MSPFIYFSICENYYTLSMPVDLIELCFDRPFVCGIVDLEGGAPLFLGTVETLG